MSLFLGVGEELDKKKKMEVTEKKEILTIVTYCDHFLYIFMLSFFSFQLKRWPPLISCLVLKLGNFWWRPSTVI